jgi:hypothetical protein
VRITPRDRELLAFTAEHHFVLAEHVRVLLGTTLSAADARLRALAGAGLINRRPVFHDQPPLNWVTSRGVAAIAGDLKPPQLDLHTFEHDVGVAWLWLAARAGAFGPAQAVIGERRLRSEDGRREAGEPPLAVRLGGVGPKGQERLHYPDLLLVSRGGKRVALELELTDKGLRRREQILAGYSSEGRIDAVVYLVTSRRLGHSIAKSAERLRMAPRVYVQLVDGSSRASEPTAGREAGRSHRSTRSVNQAAMQR